MGRKLKGHFCANTTFIDFGKIGGTREEWGRIDRSGAT